MLSLCRRIVLAFVFATLAVSFQPMTRAADEPVKLDTRRAERMFADYFAAETAELAGRVVNEIETKEDWLARKGELRRQLHEMLGLDPLPERTPLQATVTGTVDHPEFTVENVHFQSSPRLYVTGNLYVPKGLTKPAPAVLYVCGHSRVAIDGVSYGGKTNYQHHGAWLARHGYVCLTIDTLQLGEIEGIHHGTHQYGRFWWLSRGYVPTGVEAWNCIRALDYLQSRKEVDGERLGVTGRSGGGSYSWWIAALDERIKAAVPVAGITDLQNYVVDGKVDGHCDCMFMLNTYRWDYGTVSSLVAPRPLLLSNTDDDRIFPLDGVERIHWQTKKIYGLLGAAKKLGLQISWGGHYDTQELQVAAFRWFNLHLKQDDHKIGTAALKLFEPQQLQVFKKLPEDQLNTRIDEFFVPPAGKPKVPADASEWAAMRDGWMKNLREKSFRAWPEADEPLNVDERRVHASGEQRAYIQLDFTSEGPMKLAVSIPHLVAGADVEHLTLHVGGSGYVGYPGENQKVWPASFSPRGYDETAWDPSPKKQAQLRRRFMLLGQTLEGQQIYDVRRAIQALHEVPELKNAKITLTADGPMAGLALYAALFEPSVERLELSNLAPSHMPSADEPRRFAPPLLNVLRYLDVPQTVAMVAERATVEIKTNDATSWQYPQAVAKGLGWKDRVVITTTK